MGRSECVKPYNYRAGSPAAPGAGATAAGRSLSQRVARTVWRACLDGAVGRTLALAWTRTPPPTAATLGGGACSLR
jgi:hypothetical protein